MSLDTGFLVSAVNNLWVVLSFNARKAIAEYQNDQQGSNGHFNNLQQNDLVWSLAKFSGR